MNEIQSATDEIKRLKRELKQANKVYTKISDARMRKLRMIRELNKEIYTMAVARIHLLQLEQEQHGNFVP